MSELLAKPSEDVDQDLEVEDEAQASEARNKEGDDKDVVYQINSFGADYLVDGLVARLDREDIYRPDFQRQFVWSVNQASRFIESILLGLPIPGIFLYREEPSKKHLIIDGLQRLTTLQSFQKGRLPNSDRVFRLVGVKERFEGKTLDELDAVDQRRFNDATIHATIIQQTLPEGDTSSIYHIFDRLNSGGTPLQPQEIRAAIYHGDFQKLLEELSNDANWRKIFGPRNKRGKDQELILRFLALAFDRENYASPMKSFLNKFMSTHRDLSGGDRAQFQQTFKRAVDIVVDRIGDRPFRPQRSLNTAVFDAVMVAIVSCPDLKLDDLKARYDRLLEDDEFDQASSRATADEANVDTRIRRAVAFLGC